MTRSPSIRLRNSCNPVAGIWSSSAYPAGRVHRGPHAQHLMVGRPRDQPIFAVTEQPCPARGAPFHNAAPAQPYAAVAPLAPLGFDQLTPEEQPDTAARIDTFRAGLAA